jgi:hypothetical protein
MYPGNHVNSGIVTVPTKLKTRKNAPTTHLAYITDKEAGVLKKLKKGVPHKGPNGIPNYDSFDWMSGAQEDTSYDPWSDGSRSDTSYSTRDVRAAPGTMKDPEKGTREAFRQKIERSGGKTASFDGYEMSPSERVARIKNYFTRNKRYLEDPIFVTEDLSYDELGKIASEGERLMDLEQSSDEDETEDWSSFFDPLKGLTDITGPTSKDWYQDEGALDTGGPGLGGLDTYDGGYDDLGAIYAAGLGQGQKQLGAGEHIPQGLEMLDYMVRLHKENPYTQLAMARDGGIMNLVK